MISIHSSMAIVVFFSPLLTAPVDAAASAASTPSSMFDFLNYLIRYQRELSVMDDTSSCFNVPKRYCGNLCL